MMIPSPKKSLLLGHLPYLTKGKGGCLVASLYLLHDQLGPIYSIDVVGRRWIVCNDPSMMKKALIENLNFFHKGATLEAAHSLEIGRRGLTETEGPEWLNQHKMLKPFFSSKSTDTNNALTHKVMDKASLFIRRHNDLEILDFCNRVAFSFVTRMSSGYESDCLNDLKNIDPLFKFQKYIVDQFLMRLKFGVKSKFIPTPSNILFNKRRHDYQDFFRTLIKAFKEKHSDRDDMVLYHLINGKYGDRKLTEEEIIDQIYTIIGGGFESTGSTFHWALYELSKSQDLIDKIRVELERCGPPTSWNAEKLATCELLVATIEETLRLHTTFPIVGREVKEDIKINDFLYTKNAFAFFMTGKMHIGSCWGKDAHEFKPERFLDPKNREMIKDNYFPFGIGPRKCIGDKMARHQLIIMVARIIMEFDLELLPDQKIIPFQALTNGSKYGIKMRFTPRKK